MIKIWDEGDYMDARHLENYIMIQLRCYTFNCLLRNGICNMKIWAEGDWFMNHFMGKIWIYGSI